jgi:hypothetical protein
MAPLSPDQCLKRLRQLYRDAMKCTPDSDQAAIDWAYQVETWATQQIAHRGWSFQAAEAVVRSTRIIRKRATIAAQEAAL